MMMTTK